MPRNECHNLLQIPPSVPAEPDRSVCPEQKIMIRKYGATMVFVGVIIGAFEHNLLKIYFFAK